jgi:hypothetical protein
MTVQATSTWIPRGDGGQFVKAVIEPKAIEAAQDVGEIILAEAQAIVPVDSGELRDSGHVVLNTDGATVLTTVQFDAGHAAYVEFGTGVRGAASEGAGPYPYDPAWPGMVAQPYLRPALDATRPELLGEYALRMRY